MVDEKLWNKIEKMHEEIILLRIDIAKLKLKASTWGLASGIVGSIGIYLLRGSL